MLSNTTPAAGPQELQSTKQVGTVFFGSDSTSQTSATFKVSTAPFFLSAYALQNGDSIAIQQVIGDGSGTETAPFSPVIGPITLTPTVTCVRIDYPGRYRLVHTGPSALGTFTVVGAAQVMASDSLAGLAQALAGVISNLGTTVTGTTPIVVTNPTPLAYNIALDWTYQDLGSVTGAVNVDWRQSRAFVATLTGTTLTDFEITNLPAEAGFLFLKVIQGDAGDNTIQFANLWPTALINAGSVQPANTLGVATYYTFFYDGSVTRLVHYAASDTSVGSYYNGASYFVAGNNTTKQIATIPQQYGAYALASGTNTYTCGFTPSLATGFSTGVTYTVKFTNANTGASTLNPDGAGAVAIQRRGIAVTAGQIPALSTLNLLFDGTNLQIVGAA